MNLKKHKPRYTNNLYLSQFKHLMRTLNTLIVYESVKEIYASYDKSKEKYQFHLNINYESNHTNGLKLLYSRTNALKKINQKKEIEEAIFSTVSLEKQQLQVLNNLKKLIDQYDIEDSKGNLNNFFLIDEEIALQKINDLVPTNLKTQYRPKNKRKYIDTNVAKKIYYLVKNQLNFEDINDIRILENKRIDTKKEIRERVDKELDRLESDLTWLKMSTYHDTLEIHSSKEELEYAIHYYHVNSVEKYNLASFTLEELQDQLELIEAREWINEKDSSYNKPLVDEITNKLGSYFKEYEELKKLFDKNKRNLTKNGISRYLSNPQKEVDEARNMTSNIRRKIVIKELRKKHDHILNMSENAKYHFILLNSHLGKYYERFQSFKNFENQKSSSTDSEPIEDIKGVEFNGRYHTKEELEYHGIDIYDIIEENKENDELEKQHEYSKAQEKVENQELESYLCGNNISKSEYDFQSFIPLLIDHINEIMGNNISELTDCELFDDYIHHIRDMDLHEEYDYYHIGQLRHEFDQMLQEIEKFGLDRIYNEIEKNFLENEDDTN